MNHITLVMAYYDNSQMLREQCAYLRGLPAELRSHIDLIVVDDGSPRAPAQYEDIDIAAFSIYRIKVDVRWNQDAARNIGVRHARTDWVLLTDMDHIVSKELWEKLVYGVWDPGVAYQFTRVSAPDCSFYKPHPNSWFLLRRLYEHIRGYDERFAGYYGTDGDFKKRLQKVAELETIDAPIIRYPREVIADASTTTYERKADFDKPAIKRILEERALEKDPRPRNFLFPYHKVPAP